MRGKNSTAGHALVDVWLIHLAGAKPAIMEMLRYVEQARLGGGIGRNPCRVRQRSYVPWWSRVMRPCTLYNGEERWQANFAPDKGSSPLARAVEVGVAHSLILEIACRPASSCGACGCLESQVKNIKMIQLLLELRSGQGATGHQQLPELW